MEHPTDLSYIINHLGEDHASYFNAIAPPIVQTSNFQFATVAEIERHLKMRWVVISTAED